MLLMLENFDNARALRDFVSWQKLQLDLTSNFVSGSGKNGSNAFNLDGGCYIKVKESTRLVVGFYVRTYTTGYFKAYYWHPSNGYFYESFRITMTRSSNGKVTISFYNPQQTSIENYPAIANQIAYQDTETGYSLIEIMLDLENAEAHMGKLKIAIDGIEYVNLSNVVTAPINQWTDGLDSMQATYGAFTLSGFGSVDSVYVCNEDKGFNDDFFGPYDISTLAPIADGSYSNWRKQQYSEAVDDLDPASNASYVSKIPFDPENAEYLSVNASQTLVQDLYLFAAENIQNDLDIFAVEHQIWFKGLSEEQLEEISAITPIGQASGQSISFANEFTDVAQAYYYKQIRALYDVVPTTSAAWNWENLSLTQFGYCFFETELVSVLDSCTVEAVSPLVGVSANLTDGDSGTYVQVGIINIALSEPTIIREVTFLVNYSRALNSGTCVDTDGLTHTFSVEYDSDTSIKTAKLDMDYAQTEIVSMRFAGEASFYDGGHFDCYIYELDVFTWERVGV